MNNNEGKVIIASFFGTSEEFKIEIEQQKQAISLAMKKMKNGEPYDLDSALEIVKSSLSSVTK